MRVYRGVYLCILLAKGGRPVIYGDALVLEIGVVEMPQLMVGVPSETDQVQRPLLVVVQRPFRHRGESVARPVEDEPALIVSGASPLPFPDLDQVCIEALSDHDPSVAALVLGLADLEPAVLRLPCDRLVDDEHVLEPQVVELQSQAFAQSEALVAHHEEYAVRRAVPSVEHLYCVQERIVLVHRPDALLLLPSLQLLVVRRLEVPDVLRHIQLHLKILHARQLAFP